MWKATAWTARVAGVVLLFALVWYAWAAVRFYTGRPVIAVDYVGRINARVNAIPESERAWPRYRAAYLGAPIDALVEESRLGEARKIGAWPGEAGWDEVSAWLKTMEPTLDEVREASRLEHFGAVVSAEEDPEIRARRDEINGTSIRGPSEAAPTPAPETTKETPLISTVLPQVSVVRSFAIWLAADARSAAASSGGADGGAVGARAAADVVAMCSMARQASEAKDAMLVSQMVSLSVYTLALDTVDGILARSPEAWTDDQLIELAHTLAGYQGGTLAVHLDGERAMFLDLVQRVYTDDRKGNGHLCNAGLWGMVGAVPGLVDDASARGRLGSLAGPVYSSLGDSRRGVVEFYDRVMSEQKRETLTPLWLRNGSGDDVWWSVVVRPDGFMGKTRHWLVRVIFPPLGQIGTSVEIVTQRRDTTLAAIALEMFKRRNGSYPGTLDALVPEFLPVVPPDRYTGEPLNYKLDEAGRPVLYSVGPDRKDDAGRSAVDNERKRNETAGNSGLTLDEFNALPAMTKRAYEGDWILFPPTRTEDETKAAR